MSSKSDVKSFVAEQEEAIGRVCEKDANRSRTSEGRWNVSASDPWIVNAADRNAFKRFRQRAVTVHQHFDFSRCEPTCNALVICPQVVIPQNCVCSKPRLEPGERSTQRLEVLGPAPDVVP